MAIRRTDIRPHEKLPKRTNARMNYGPLLPRRTQSKTRGCGVEGAARYGAVLAVSLLWEFRFSYELRLTYLKRYVKRSRHGTDGQTDRIDT